MVVVEARDEARAVLVLLVLGAAIPPVEMGVHDEVLVTCGAAIHETPLSPWSGGRASCFARVRGHRPDGRILRHPENWPGSASRRMLATIVAGASVLRGGCDRGRQGRDARRRVAGGGPRRGAGPEGPPSLRRARPRRARGDRRLPRPIPAKAVAQQLGISLGTSYRVLHTLEHAGYVVRLGHGCFGFGGKATSLSRAFQESLDVVGTLRPALKRLAAEAEEDTYLALFRGGEIAVAEVIEGSNALHIGGPRGRVQPRGPRVGARQGAPRRMPRRGDRRLPRAAAPRALTRATLVRRRDIKDDLHAVRETGVGHDLEELAEGCCCVAAPVRDARGAVVGSVGLSTPTDRWREEAASRGSAFRRRPGVRVRTRPRRRPRSRWMVPRPGESPPRP